ncbi:MAG TPA: hypothetical protein VEC57_19805 [Candidatus Limnocylindrales bacterium]|nr:hypothetical protein [Candidatus Limnocylindrales bacterium]
MSSATSSVKIGNKASAARFARTRARSYIAATRQDEREEGPGAQRTPERALMMAVLEDAIACYAGRLKAPRENPKILRRQAEHWLQSEDWDSPFSFNNVCDALALDPKALRQRILG